MKEKILALLLAKFAGVRKDGLAQLATAMSIQAADESEATALVEKITADKVNDFVKDWRKDVDKEVSESKKTIEDNLKKKYDFVEKKEPANPDPDKKDPNDIAAIVAAAVSKAVEPLQQKLLGFEGAKTNETRLQQLQSKLDGLPESFKKQKVEDFSLMQFESDEKFTEYLAKMETGVAEFKQELADNGLSGHSKPLFGDGKLSEEDAFVNSMKAINSEETK